MLLVGVGVVAVIVAKLYCSVVLSREETWDAQASAQLGQSAGFPRRGATRVVAGRQQRRIVIARLPITASRVAVLSFVVVYQASQVFVFGLFPPPVPSQSPYSQVPERYPRAELMVRPLLLLGVVAWRGDWRALTSGERVELLEVEFEVRVLVWGIWLVIVMRSGHGSSGWLER